MHPVGSNARETNSYGRASRQGQWQPDLEEGLQDRAANGDVPLDLTSCLLAHCSYESKLDLLQL